ncbi:MAG: hypothetical protein FWE71_00720 [Nocardioidaceae bacterium]|nr:hypothetical protein [Nocardioidaceae bacterium]MCL2612665.1 hypothetical protein [Nocardioidaceae bacterium]
MVHCDFCGCEAPSDPPPITWSTSVEGGRRRTFCEECSRAHLRSMEARLDSEWW